MTKTDIKIAVLGAGIMGRGIAQAFAMGGSRVALLSRKEATLASAMAHIGTNLELLGSFELVADPRGALGRLSPTTNLAQALDGAALIAEAIDEALPAKRALFSKCERLAGPRAIFATNASHLDPEDIFAHLATRDRCLAAHWFNPAQLIPLVEVAKLSGTGEEPFERAVGILRGAGKVAVKLKKPVQGLLVNRLFCAMAREACHLLELGVADAEDIDEAVKNTIGIRNFAIGVFKTMDFGGLADWHDCMELLLPLMDNSAAPPESISSRLREGRAGIRAGQGFYHYDRPFDSSVPDEEIVRRDETLMRLLRLGGFSW
jgi:3-hydroxybutyryl-CoA dehydrogenase